MTGDLYQRVVASTGLSPLLGPGTVRRALNSAGVDNPATASPAEYRVALPQLRRRLLVYLPADEADARTHDIEALLEAVERDES